MSLYLISILSQLHLRYLTRKHSLSYRFCMLLLQIIIRADCFCSCRVKIERLFSVSFLLLLLKVHVLLIVILTLQVLPLFFQLFFYSFSFFIVVGILQCFGISWKQLRSLFLKNFSSMLMLLLLDWQLQRTLLIDFSC